MRVDLQKKKRKKKKEREENQRKRKREELAKNARQRRSGRRETSGFVYLRLENTPRIGIMGESRTRYNTAGRWPRYYSNYTAPWLRDVKWVVTRAYKQRPSPAHFPTRVWKIYRHARNRRSLCGRPSPFPPPFPALPIPRAPLMAAMHFYRNTKSGIFTLREQWLDNDTLSVRGEGMKKKMNTTIRSLCRFKSRSRNNIARSLFPHHSKNKIALGWNDNVLYFYLQCI